MIRSFLKFTSFAHFWLGIALACTLPSTLVAADEATTSALTGPYNIQPRPATELLGRSLGLTAGVLAVGAVLLVASRKYTSRLLPEQGLGPTHAAAQRPRVTGRVRLTPRQTVHVLAIGQRVLVLGTGPQGAPELLTEWSLETYDSQNIPPDDLMDASTLPMPAHTDVENAA